TITPCFSDPRALPSFPTRRSSDLRRAGAVDREPLAVLRLPGGHIVRPGGDRLVAAGPSAAQLGGGVLYADAGPGHAPAGHRADRSEEHTSELSHVKISYAVFCLKK